MKKWDINPNRGHFVEPNWQGDYMMDGDYKDYVRNSLWMKIEKLTRSGKVLLVNDKGRFHSVPPKNIDLCVESMHDY